MAADSQQSADVPGPEGGASGKRLHALIECSLQLNEAQDLPTLLRRVLMMATEQVGADRGTLFRKKPGEDLLVAEHFAGEELATLTLAPDQGLAGEVFQTGRPLRIDDAYADPRFDSSIDKRTGYSTHNMLVVPLRLRTGEVVGVLQLLNKASGPFSEEDEDFLEAFGALSAVALENARLISERIRNERLAAVGTWAATLVHDLRNPLSGIRGYADLILQNPPEDLRQRCVAGIRRQTVRMDHMVRSILSFVQGRAAFLFSKVDVDELLTEIVEDLDAAHRDEDITIVRSGSRVGTCRLDPMAIRRLVDNLVRNAAEAMEAGGRIEIGGALADGEVHFWVADDGPGIPEVRQREMFDVFQTSGKEGGTGLGLHVVRSTIDGHDGRISVTSSSEKGTRFDIRLPITGPAADTP